jgi:hypothetical protein
LPEFSDFIVFADESGDHSLTTIHADYPVFVLALCLFHKEEYAQVTVPAVLRLKFKHFGHEQVILHEREIRKTQGHFRFLTDATRRPAFYADLDELVRQAPFTLIAAAIHKRRALHASVGSNPYHVALGFGLERLFLHLKGLGCREGTTHMLFERRGAKEDSELELEFRRVCDGTAILEAVIRSRSSWRTRNATQLGSRLRISWPVRSAGRSLIRRSPIARTTSWPASSAAGRTGRRRGGD